MHSFRAFHRRYLSLVSVVLALVGLPQPALAEEHAEGEIGVDILEMCIDPETSNQAIVDYLIARDWQFVELDEAKTLVPPKDVDAFSPEQIFGFAYYAFTFGGRHEASRTFPQSYLDEFMATTIQLNFFTREGRSVSMAGPNDEVMAMDFGRPLETTGSLDKRTRTKCSFTALREIIETNLFDVIPGEPIQRDFVTLDANATGLTGPIVAYGVITAEAALLSDVFETEVPALLAFMVRLDLDAD